MGVRFMEIWQMRYFMQVYCDKSFSKAAKKLYISQQGLSKTIKNIEDEFQVPLFERTAKGVSPTIFGELLFEKTQQILSDYDEMISIVQKKLLVKEQTISIGISNLLFTDRLSSIISRFQEDYPNIKLEIIELGSYTCENYLKDNRIDICFAIKPDNLSEFDFIPISVFNLVLFANKQNPVSDKPFIKFDELKKEKFIMLSSEYKIRKFTLEQCIKSGFYPDIVITANQFDIIIELVNRNKGIVILPAFHSVKAVRICENIAVVLFQDILYEIESGFIFNKKKNFNYVANIFIYYILKSLND
jgi:DNA-binding transcriptional LysR family regulator